MVWLVCCHGDAMTVLAGFLSDTEIACCGSFGYMTEYVNGKYGPHYPMPATTDNGKIAANWLHLRLCPLYYEGKQDVPCEVCIDRFLDGLE